MKINKVFLENFFIIPIIGSVNATFELKGAPKMTKTYLTTSELAERIKYDERTIRDRLKDSVLIEGIHYIRPFGGRKILYLWEQIEKDMHCAPSLQNLMAGM